MAVCPYCDHDNIDGVDTCDECGQPLDDLYLSDPPTAVERGLLNDHIRVLAPRRPISVAPETPVRDVLRMLVDQNIGCVVVAEGETLKGIFSERDALLKLGTRAAELGDQPVSDFMTDKVETLEANSKIAFAVQRMDLGSYRHIPIVNEENNTNGIISARDILRYLTELMTVE